MSSFERRSQRVRNSLKRKSRGRVRLSVHRSGQHIYAQIIDDATSMTLASASTLDKDLRAKLKSTASTDAAREVGTLIAKRAAEKSIAQVVFDRGGYLYHGRVKALADAAREAGLDF